MKKHIIILAAIFLFFGITLGILFIHAHILFFSISSKLFEESSVIDTSSSIFQRWLDDFRIYMNYFGKLGANPPLALITIITSITFGYGLLKYKPWARILGFVLL